MRMEEPDSDLGAVLKKAGMTTFPFNLPPSTDGTDEPGIVRVVIPASEMWMVNLLRNFPPSRRNAGALVLAGRLGRHAHFSSLCGRRSERRFRMNRFQKTTAYRELVKTLQHTGPPDDLFWKLVGEVRTPIPELLDHARYLRPEDQQSDCPGYVGFRSMLLDEIDETERYIDEICSPYPVDAQVRDHLKLTVGGSFLRKTLRVCRQPIIQRTGVDFVGRFLHDIDRSRPYLVGEAARVLYRRARRLMTRAERRVFCLMYMQHLPRFGAAPSIPFGGITFMFDPVLQGVLNDVSLAGLIILVIGFKERGQDGADWGKELQSRFKAYLAFYSYWLGLTRDRERSERKARRLKARLGRRSSMDIERVGDNITTRGSASGWDEALRAIVGENDVSLVLKRLGVSDSRGVYERYWTQGESQREIASKLGITPQAVSALVRRITNKILERLEEKGAVPPGTRLRKRRWVPRG